MKNVVFESNDIAIPMFEIEAADEMEQLVRVLTVNGYEVQVAPVYETQAGLEAKGCRVYAHTKPRILYWVVKVLGMIEKPVYKM